MADQDNLGTPTIIRSDPGIKRDGTIFEGNNYIDGQWCRFHRGLPRKMGGYRAVTSTIPEQSRGLTSFSSTGIQYIHTGGQSTLFQVQANTDGVFSTSNTRTPAALVATSDNLWQFDTLFDSVSGQNVLIAHAGQNLTNIDNAVTSKIFYGPVTGSGVLVDTGVAEESGGVLALPPYLFKFGSNGHVAWSVPNKPTDFLSLGSGDAYITAQKIVKGLPLRGSSAPAGLFWSLDSLIQGGFVGGDKVWDFNTVSTDSSILSSQGVVEYDGVYYWVGVDRFLRFNGVVQEVTNNMNLNWFFDNLNMSQRQKVFAIKVPRWGEIWWCFPFGNATECTHAIIYNVREGYWYDTILPLSLRTSGIYAKVYSKPFMIDNLPTGVGTGYTLWQHETGTDQIDGTSVNAIQSFFETSEISFVAGQNPQNKALRVSRMEQDFVQSGDMTITVTGRSNARAPEDVSATVTFPATASNASEQTVPLKAVRRLMRFKFESNVAGGDYQMGQCLAHIGEADGRITT